MSLTVPVIDHLNSICRSRNAIKIGGRNRKSRRRLATVLKPINQLFHIGESLSVYRIVSDKHLERIKDRLESCRVDPKNDTPILSVLLTARHYQQHHSTKQVRDHKRTSMREWFD